MSDEISTEAAVAGEAAAAAVQEVQSRESVSEAATEAVYAATVAEDTAGAALETASEAAMAAGESRQTSEIAVETAVSAQNLASETHESLSGWTERIESRFSQLESKWETVLTALQSVSQEPEQNSETDVAEVPVNDNTQATDNAEGTEDSRNAGEPSSTQPGRRRVVGRRR